MQLWLWLLLLLGAIVIGSTALFSSVVSLGGEAGRSRLLRVAYPLYKYVFNPRTLRSAARGDSPYGVLHHIGRSSGAAYETPVEADRTSDGVIVPLHRLGVAHYLSLKNASRVDLQPALSVAATS